MDQQFVSCLISSVVPQLESDEQKRLLSEKCMELLRRMDKKFVSGSLGKGESERAAIALELACRLLRISFDRSKLFSSSVMQGQSLNSLVDTVKKALNLEFVSSSVGEVLCVRFGQPIQSAAQQLIDRVESLRDSSNSSATSALTAAAYFIVLKNKRVAINQTEFLSLVNVDAGLFRSSLNAIKEKCAISNQKAKVNLVTAESQQAVGLGRGMSLASFLDSTLGFAESSLSASKEADTESANKKRKTSVTVALPNTTKLPSGPIICTNSSTAQVSEQERNFVLNSRNKHILSIRNRIVASAEVKKVNSIAAGAASFCSFSPQSVETATGEFGSEQTEAFESKESRNTREQYLKIREQVLGRRRARDQISEG